MAKPKVYTYETAPLKSKYMAMNLVYFPFMLMKLSVRTADSLGARAFSLTITF